MTAIITFKHCKWVFTLVLTILFFSCTNTEIEELPQNTIAHWNIKEITTSKYRENLFESAFEDLIVNNKVEAAKAKIDTLSIIQENIDDSRFSARVLRLKGLFSGLIKDFDKMHFFLNSADSLFKNQGQQVADLSLTANYRAMLLRDQKQINEMEKVLQEAWLPAQQNNDIMGMLHLTHELCVFFGFDKQDYKKSIAYGELYFDLCRTYENTQNLHYKTEIEHRHRVEHTSPIIDLMLAKGYIAEKKYRRAMPHLNRVLPFFEAYDDYEKIKRIHLNYMDVYRGLNDQKSFNKHFEQYIKNTNEYNELLSKRSVEALKLNMANEKEIYQLRLYKKESEYVEEIAQRNMVIIQLLLLASILGTLALVYFVKQNRFLVSLNSMIHEDNNDAKQLINKLKRIIRDKNKLQEKLEHIQDAIAMDLHDNFGNRLSAIHTSSDILKNLMHKKNRDPKAFKLFLNGLNTSISQLSSDVKDLLWANNSKNNKLSMVIARLHEISFELLNQNEIELNFIYVLAEKDYLLEKYWNRQIVLIIKEALNNAIKYSETKKIDLTFEVDDLHKLRLTCRDFGKGFNMVSLARKSGLVHMQKRAKSIDANVSIVSAPKKGTSVVFTSDIPLKPLKELKSVLKPVV